MGLNLGILMLWRESRNLSLNTAIRSFLEKVLIFLSNEFKCMIPFCLALGEMDVYSICHSVNTSGASDCF